MTSYSNIVVVFSDEVGRPRNLQVLGENDTIADEVLSPEVRDAVTKVPELTEATGNLQTQIDSIEGISVTAIEQDIIVLKDATGVLNDQVTGLYTATAGLYNQVTAIEGIDITDVQNDIQILFDNTGTNFNDITGFYQITADLDNDILDNTTQITALKDATSVIDGKFGGIYNSTADNYFQITSLKEATGTLQTAIDAIDGATDVTALEQDIQALYDGTGDNYTQITSIKDATSVIDGKFGGIYDSTGDLEDQIYAVGLVTGTNQGLISTLNGQMFTAQSDIIALEQATGTNFHDITGIKDVTADLDSEILANFNQITSLKDATATIDGKFGGIYDSTADIDGQLTAVVAATATLQTAVININANVLENIDDITSLKSATATIDAKFPGIYDATGDLTGVIQQFDNRFTDIESDVLTNADNIQINSGKFPGIYQGTGTNFHDITGIKDVTADLDTRIFNNFYQITSLKDATGDLQSQINSIYDQTGDNYHDITAVKDATGDIAVDVLTNFNQVTSLKDATASLAGDIAAIDGVSNPMTEPLDLDDFKMINVSILSGDGIQFISEGDAIIRSGWGGSIAAATGTISFIAGDLKLKPDPADNPNFIIPLGKGLLVTDGSGVGVSGDDGTTVDAPEDGSVLMLDTAAQKLKYKKIKGGNIEPISIGGDRLINGTIGDDQIADGGITGGKLANNTVSGNQLAAGAATDNIQTNGLNYLMFPSLPDQRILGNNSGFGGTTEQLTDADVRAIINVADGATANTGALADLDTVGTDQIDATAVTTAKIQANAITNTLISTNTIANTKLAKRTTTCVLGSTGGVSNVVDLTMTQLKDMISVDGNYTIDSTAPGSPSDGDIWYNTTENELFTYDSGRGHWFGAPYYISMGKTTSTTAGTGHFLYVGHQGTTAVTAERGWLVPHDMTITGVRGHTQSTFDGWTFRVDKNSGGTTTNGVVSTGALGAVDTYSDFTLDVDVAAADIIGMAGVNGSVTLNNSTFIIEIRKRL